MSYQTSLDMDFADGEYLFDLKLPQLIELQEKRKAGIFTIYGRVLKGRYLIEGLMIADTSQAEAFAEDIFETIRLGLIGGGKGIVDGVETDVSSLRAKALVERYCHSAPLRESWAIAAAILGARVEGYEPEKKVAPAKAPAKPETTSIRRRSSPAAR